MLKRMYQKAIFIWQHPRYWRGILVCPHSEPLHYHHDGCPACWLEEDSLLKKIRDREA